MQKKSAKTKSALHWRNYDASLSLLSITIKKFKIDSRIFWKIMLIDNNNIFDIPHPEFRVESRKPDQFFATSVHSGPCHKSEW